MLKVAEDDDNSFDDDENVHGDDNFIEDDDDEKVGDNSCILSQKLRKVPHDRNVKYVRK